MRMLYVNVCEEKAYTGHKLFDKEWAENLLSIGKVDLIQPHDYWFNGVDNEVNIITYEYNKKYIACLNKGIFKYGLLKRLDTYIHILNGRMYSYIERLDRDNNYDIIILAHIDYLMFNFRFWNSKILKKLYLIEHSPGIYLRNSYKLMCSLWKNKIHHIVMEKAAIPFYIEKMHISKNLIHYVPHPLNTVKIVDVNKVRKYNIVALSNSNSDEEIRKIIDLEETSGFFKNNQISAIIRSKNIEYNNEYLNIFTGWVSLSFKDFYGYILGADIILVPFSSEFGSRTSGTIIDGLSNNKLVVGTKFETMCQYESDYPNICKTYSSMENLTDIIVSYFNNKELLSELDFENFKKERSLETMKEIYINVFCNRIVNR